MDLVCRVGIYEASETAPLAQPSVSCKRWFRVVLGVVWMRAVPAVQAMAHVAALAGFLTFLQCHLMGWFTGTCLFIRLSNGFPCSFHLSERHIHQYDHGAKDCRAEAELARWADETSARSEGWSGVRYDEGIGHGRSAQSMRGEEVFEEHERPWSWVLISSLSFFHLHTLCILHSFYFSFSFLIVHSLYLTFFTTPPW